MSNCLSLSTLTAESGDPLSPITLRLYAKSREMPGFIRVSEKISWSRNRRFQASRGVTYWRRYWR